MNNTITWGELITIVSFLLGAALLFYLVLAAANLVRMMRNLNKMVENIRPDIEKTLKNLPEISENASKVTGLIKENMEDVTKVIENVGKISESAKNAAEIIQKDIIIKAKGLLDVADGVRRYFARKKGSANQNVKHGSAVYRYTYRKGQEQPEAVTVFKEEAAPADEAAGISPERDAYRQEKT